jgi:hypothetical protein
MTVRNADTNVLIALLIFPGVGAVFGGFVLIISPTGALFKMPLSMLAHSGFTSFFISGLILFFLIGSGPLAISVALMKTPESKLAEFFNCFSDMYWAWTFTVCIAFALIIWILTEMSLTQSLHWSYSFYMLLALAIVSMALLPAVRNDYRKTNRRVLI